MLQSLEAQYGSGRGRGHSASSSSAGSSRPKRSSSSNKKASETECTLRPSRLNVELRIGDEKHMLKEWITLLLKAENTERARREAVTNDLIASLVNSDEFAKLQGWIDEATEACKVQKEEKVQKEKEGGSTGKAKAGKAKDKTATADFPKGFGFLGTWNVPESSTEPRPFLKHTKADQNVAHASSLFSAMPVELWGDETQGFHKILKEWIIRSVTAETGAGPQEASAAAAGAKGGGKRRLIPIPTQTQASGAGAARGGTSLELLLAYADAMLAKPTNVASADLLPASENNRRFYDETDWPTVERIIQAIDTLEGELEDESLGGKKRIANRRKINDHIDELRMLRLKAQRQRTGNPPLALTYERGEEEDDEDEGGESIDEDEPRSDNDEYGDEYGDEYDLGHERDQLSDGTPFVEHDPINDEISDSDEAEEAAERRYFPKGENAASKALESQLLLANAGASSSTSAQQPHQPPLLLHRGASGSSSPSPAKRKRKT